MPPRKERPYPKLHILSGREFKKVDRTFGLTYSPTSKEKKFSTNHKIGLMKKEGLLQTRKGVVTYSTPSGNEVTIRRRHLQLTGKGYMAWLLKTGGPANIMKIALAERNEKKYKAYAHRIIEWARDDVRQNNLFRRNGTHVRRPPHQNPRKIVEYLDEYYSDCENLLEILDHKLAKVEGTPHHARVQRKIIRLEGWMDLVEYTIEAIKKREISIPN